MEYNDIYNSHCIIKLKSGREIRMDELNQRRTYAGLMIGSPNQRSNQWVMSGILQRARSFVAGSPAVLIEPERRDFRKLPGDAGDPSDTRPERQVEWLPEVTSIAEFHSMSPARDLQKDASTLVVIWFQPDFGLPTPEFADEHLATIDWNSKAMDYEW